METAKDKVRFPFALTALGAIYAGVCFLNYGVPAFFGRPDIVGIRAFLFQFAILAFLYIIGILVVFRKSSTRFAIAVILISGAAFRIFLVPTDPVLSDDIHRYIWDGKVQAAGINPYSYPPSATELSPLKDEIIHPGINRPDAVTIYPAGAQAFFRLSRFLTGDSIYAFKAVMAFFDCLTMLLLVGLLGKRGIDGTRILIYAWNPLVVYEIAQSGHLEAAAVFLVVLSLYFHAARRKALSVLGVSLAASVKLYPGLLLAAFLNKGERLKGIALFAFALLAFYMPYSFSGASVAGFLPDYLSDPYENFNLALKYLLMALIDMDYQLINLIFMAIILASATVVFFREKTKRPERYALLLAGILTVFMPVALHPWYVVWLVPFLVFYPSPAWIAFTLLVPLSYLKYVTRDGIMPLWVLLTEYIPLFAFLFAEFLVREYRLRYGVALSAIRRGDSV